MNILIKFSITSPSDEPRLIPITPLMNCKSLLILSLIRITLVFAWPDPGGPAAVIAVEIANNITSQTNNQQKLN